MQILTDTTHSVTVVTGSAVSTDYVVSWADNTSSTFTPGSGHGNISTATTTTVIAAPAASTQRAIKGLMITNRHASSSQTVQVFKTVGASSYAISQNLTLLAGQTAVLSESGLSVCNDGYVFVAPGKLLQSQNSLSLIGTDGTTQTFPSTNAVIARTDAAQTFTGNQTYSNRVLVDDTTDATTTTDGSLQTDGGLSVAKKGYFGNTVTSLFSDTSTAGSKYGIESVLTANPGSSSSASFRAGHFQTLTSAACSQNISSDMYGVLSECSHSGTGTTISGVIGNRAVALNKSNSSTVTFLSGLYVSNWGSSVAGGVTTGAYGLYITPPTTTGTITNAYGLYIGSVSGAATLNYSIYVAGGVAKINDTTASTSTTTGALIVAGGIGVAGTVTATLFSGNVKAYGSNESNICYEGTGGVNYINYRGATDAITTHYLCDGKAGGTRSSMELLRLISTSANASTTTSTGAIVATGGVASGDYFTGKFRAADGTAGLNATRTFYAASSSGGTVNVLNTVVIKDGIITSWTVA